MESGRCWPHGLKVLAAVAQGTAEVLPYRNESFEAVASSYLAKYVDIKRVVDECWRVLRPGGGIVFHDFTYPSGLMRNLWNAHFAILRLAGRFVTSWRMVFEQLDNLIKNRTGLTRHQLPSIAKDFGISMKGGTLQAQLR